VVVTTGLETVVPNTGAQAGQQVRRRVTQVWKRDGGQWRLELRHATIVTTP
jgi:ketosteroid isomerase-like protein